LLETNSIKKFPIFNFKTFFLTIKLLIMKNSVKIVLILVLFNYFGFAQSVTLTADCSTSSLTAVFTPNPGTVIEGAFAVIPLDIKSLRRLSDGSYIILGPWQRARFIWSFNNAQESASSSIYGNSLKFFWSWNPTFTWNNISLSDAVAFDVSVTQLLGDKRYPVRNIIGQFIGYLPVGWRPGSSCIGIDVANSDLCDPGTFIFAFAITSNTAFLGQARSEFYLDDISTLNGGGGFAIGNNIYNPVYGHTFEYGEAIKLVTFKTSGRNRGLERYRITIKNTITQQEVTTDWIYRLNIPERTDINQLWQNALGDLMDVGTYVVRLDILNPCMTQASYLNWDFTVCPLGNNCKSNLKEKDFLIYPNPVKDIAYIKDYNSEYNNKKIFDVNGRLVLESNDGKNSIDISNLDNGIYSLKLSTSDGKFKIVRISLAK
jgi:Secretion system C-terminal sorting domain